MKISQQFCWLLFFPVNHLHLVSTKLHKRFTVMQALKIFSFKATIDIIGINPFVPIPEKTLAAVFKQAGRDRSPIQVKGTINGDPYKQNLVRHLDVWRLYINTSMLKKSPERIGERISISMAFDPEPRTIKTPVAFTRALKANKEAANIFQLLNKSTQKEIVRYLANLKTKESLDRNIERAIGFLLGKERFIGRDKPGI
jgi:hypothetical protein